jgi:hypothetical protein
MIRRRITGRNPSSHARRVELTQPESYIAVSGNFNLFKLTPRERKLFAAIVELLDKFDEETAGGERPQDLSEPCG